jgi:hypothetical protein
MILTAPQCQETKPACQNCLSKNLDCRYPTISQQRVKRLRPIETETETEQEEPSSSTAMILAPPMQSSPTIFTMNDMRFFHHFLLQAHPHLPLGNEKVWVNDVPKIAHQYPFLMHAILSVSASHLTVIGAHFSPTEALTHRHLAVQGLNAAMSRISSASPSENDAMLAACYALTFESSYAGIGISDFVTMVRGCALVTLHIQDQALPSSFTLLPDTHHSFMKTRLSNLPVITGPLITSALPSFTQIDPLLTDPVLRTFYSLLLAVLVPLTTADSKNAYLAFTCVFATFYETTHTEFQDFISPDNHPAQILLAHFIALQMIVIPLTRREWDQRQSNNPRMLLGPIQWGLTIWEGLPREKRAYCGWPMRVINAGLAFVQGLRGEYDDILALAGWRREGRAAGEGRVEGS